MKTKIFALPLLLVLAALLFGAGPAGAAVKTQCPTGSGGSFADLNGDGIIRADTVVNGKSEIVNPVSPNQVCMHLTGGDGFAVMANDDRHSQYTFGFANVTYLFDGVKKDPDSLVMNAGMLAAEWSAPTIALEQDDQFYLTLTNVGMPMRPDLFDPHSVHYHGLPHSTNIFDGLPESGIMINMGASITYYYKNNDPGTYVYHCHVEATEHMQMGMLGTLYVRAGQNKLPAGTNLNGFIHQAGFKYAYNDGDGSTYYDKEYPIQLGGFDSRFHDAHIAVQPLPFAAMKDTYMMINGRGYPDTVDLNPLPISPDNPKVDNPNFHPPVSQKLSSLITATSGQKILLRISNLNVAELNTIATLGIPMKVVGKDAKLLRSTSGQNLYYGTNSLTLGGGESFDVILDTTGVAPGTYFLYTTNFQYLTNYQEDFGGMMTEIRIN